MKRTSPLSLSILASIVGIACGGGTDADPTGGRGVPLRRASVGLGGALSVRDLTLAPVADTTPAPASLPLFYVSPDGDDGNACSQSDPCRQITRALAFATQAGGRIEVADGSYDAFTITAYPGSPGAPIVIEASGTGAEVMPGSRRDTMFIDRSDYVTLRGLQSFNAPRAAVRVSGSNFARIEGCVFGNNTRWGVFTDFSDDTSIVGNEIFGSQGEHGVYVSNSSKRPVILSNVVHGNNQSGIQINADYETQDDYGLYRGVVDGLTTGARIEDNYVFDNGAGGGGAINLDGVQDSVVRNNLLYGNLATGLVMYGDADGVPGDGLGGGDGFDGDGHWGPSGMTVENNTIVMAAESRSPMLLMYSHGTKPNVIQNNILTAAGDDGAYLVVESTADVALLKSNYNVLSGVTLNHQDLDLPTWRARTSEDAQSLSAAPDALFADPSRNDFHLAPGSPAAGKGAAGDDPTDITGAARPAAAPTDIGAFEGE